MMKSGAWQVRVAVLCVATAVIGSPLASQSAPAAAADIPTWAFPTTSPPFKALVPPHDSVTPLHVLGSTRSFTLAQVTNPKEPPDWFPRSHPAMPASVAHGRASVGWACGYCHLPDGQGRAENALIAGLPVQYFLRQVAEIKSRARRSVVESWGPSRNMRAAADSANNEEIEAAARYFARIRPKRRYTVVEQAEIPVTYQVSGLYAAHPDGGTEPIGNRIIELTRDVRRHELRDPGETFVAYVPPGSIAAGKQIATKDKSVPTRACVTCHGSDLRGRGDTPPIAGRSPSYLFRQMVGFQTGARAGAQSAAMRELTARMTQDEMIAVVAYAGSLRP